ncbi:MAG: MarR family transcriptional regulator [Burkholderiales bacterium]
MNARDLDAESIAHDTEGGTSDAVRLWLRLLGCTNTIERTLRAAFRRDFSSTLPRFDLMSQLARQPEGMRMGELSRRLIVTSGNITGITDQLVAEALVTREAPADDRRAYIVRLTLAGQAAFERMAEAHATWVVDVFYGLSPQDRKQLQTLLGKLKSSIEDRKR